MKNESIKELQCNLDKLAQTHTRLINEGKFNESLNVLKNIESIIRQLKELGVSIVTQKGKDNQFLDWYNILKFFIETEQSQLIELDYSSTDAQNKHRATGKTTALVRLSNDFKIPILVKNYQNEYSYLKNCADALGLDILVIDLKMLNRPQFKNYNILLVDENTSLYLENYRGIDLHNKILIGFKKAIHQ